MGLSLLKSLGQIAGVAGIALGIAAVVLSDAVTKIGVLPEESRGQVLTVIVIVAGLLGVLALVAWVITSARGAKPPESAPAAAPAPTSVSASNGGIAVGGSMKKNTIINTASPGTGGAVPPSGGP